ncbi:PREDICTED: calcium-activated chloride channel regulator 4A-like [Priapulus caudatus]|uniref:Calcium-activated chloride channel regulator 4A-like n=1 Tax=Priapulus caudatus TaxID=37621 RepID=A0ABM1EY77_PRICU|nr:PREDICTED: calcium-activated chloride channel regulator 4A-like [Priapulus caudatus]
MSITYNGASSPPVKVTLMHPNGNVTDEDSVDEYFVDTVFQSVNIMLEGIAAVGKYDLTVINTVTGSRKIQITATSYTVEEASYPHRSGAKWRSNEIKPPEKQALYVAVTKGYNPVINARVIAYIDRPSSTTAFELVVSDNGAGADVNKDDGIYSAFVTDYTQDGRYSVSVTVDNEGVDTTIATDSLVGRGAARIKASKGRAAQESTGDFQRITNGGTFTLSSYDENTNYYPPNDVMDLLVTSIDKVAKTVTLEWTAPGADLDVGNASRYDIITSENFTALTLDPESQTLVNESEVIEGDLNAPLPSGSLEHYVVKILMKEDSSASTIVWITLRAHDDRGGVSVISNLVSATFKNFPEEEEKEEDETKLGMILGITFGVLAALIIAAIVIYCLCKSSGTSQEVTTTMEMKQADEESPAYDNPIYKP